MKTSTERILTTHTGSLHRPKDLEELYRKKLAGEPYDEAALERRLRSGVAEIVKRQVEIGIDIIDDGEFSKVDFFNYAKYRLEGIERRPVPKQSDAIRGANPFLNPQMKSVMSSVALRQRFAEFYADTEPPGGATSPPNVIQFYIPVGTAVEPPALYAVVSPLKYKAAEVQRDIDNFKAALAGVRVEETFMPVVAPAMFATRHINEYYKSEEEYYFAIADVLHEEYTALVNAGFLIQIDDVSLPGRHRIQVPEEGMEAFKGWMDLAIRALNHALRGIPEEKVRYHLCWSSQNTPHTDDAPLSDFMEALLKINAQAYHVEASNVRHGHEWTTWKEFKSKIPEHKIAMPGVICHATNVVEHPEYVSQLIQK
jgi:5-methyltetrahydropteroyltriglutamate--homocysteine methyltransferase